LATWTFGSATPVAGSLQYSNPVKPNAMKTNLISITLTAIFTLVFAPTYAQDGQRQLEEARITPPKFPARQLAVHGQYASSIDEYLTLHVQYPSASTHPRATGTEVVCIKITAEGMVMSCQVINSVSREIDEEVIRVLETTSGNWVPGTVNGEPSTMTKEVSLVFKPHPDYDLVGHAREQQAKGNRLLFIKEDPNRALKYFNQAVKLLPFQESILAARCICKYELGDENGAMEDLDRIMALNPAIKEHYEQENPEDYFSQLRQSLEREYIAEQ
jgi:tetratricopeptide (TPR) repeat protein